MKKNKKEPKKNLLNSKIIIILHRKLVINLRKGGQKETKKNYNLDLVNFITT